MRNRRHSGSALVIALAIGLLLAIQIYIIMVYSSGGFRHAEKVTGHLRAIFIGESTFSQILARLRAGRWEDRWFKGGPVQDSISMAGGNCQSYVATASTTPQKQVNVWLEAHYETATAVMFYQVVCVDDGLDFTAQMYPSFFTFLQEGDPTPLSGSLPASVSLVQSEIVEQQSNLPKALAALSSVQGNTGLQSLGNVLNIPFVAPPLDTTQPFDGPPRPQGDYVANVQTNAAGAPSAPAPAPAPSFSSPGGVLNLMTIIQTLFQSATTLILPLSPTDTPGSAFNPYFTQGGGGVSWRNANKHSISGHPFSQWAGTDLGGNGHFINALATTYQASPTSVVGIQIQTFFVALLNWFQTETTARATALSLPGPPAAMVTIAPPYTGAAFSNAYQAYVNWWSTNSP
jgi:hypothetical protein